MSTLSTDGFIYAIPTTLLSFDALRLLCRVLPGNKGSNEIDFSEECERMRAVGRFRGVLTPYDQLVPPSEPQPNEKKLGWSTQQVREVKSGLKRLKRLNEIISGYTGWLLTTQEFQDEQDALLKKWETSIRNFGFPGPLISMRPSLRLLAAKDDPDFLEFSREYDSFCIRWRLNQLAAPDLPVPTPPLLGGSIPVSIYEQLSQRGGVFYIPDTFPIDKREHLSDLLDDGLGRDPTDAANQHLGGWHKIVSKGNASRIQIRRYARLRRFIHFWRLIHSRLIPDRNPDSIALQKALAKFLKVDIKTIKNDCRRISQLLGKDWEYRCAPLVEVI